MSWQRLAHRDFGALEQNPFRSGGPIAQSTVQVALGQHFKPGTIECPHVFYPRLQQHAWLKLFAFLGTLLEGARCLLWSGGDGSGLIESLLAGRNSARLAHWVVSS